MTEEKKAPEALFGLGRMVATPGALEALTRTKEGEVSLSRMIARHVSGDWGEVPEEDAQANQEALKIGARIMSVYTLKGDGGPDVKFWVITEADRSATTVLLPEEY